MRIKVFRTSENDKSTTGEISVDGRFICHSLELPWQANQSYISCIPIGVYPAIVRYDKTDRWRIQLSDVPDRSGVQFHVGNYPSEIEGCVLTGDKAFNKENKLEGSASAYAALRRAFYGTDNPTSTPDIDLEVEVLYGVGRTQFSSIAVNNKYVYQKQASWEELVPNQSPTKITEIFRDLTTIHAKYDHMSVQMRIPLFGGKIETKWGSDPWETGPENYQRKY